MCKDKAALSSKKRVAQSVYVKEEWLNPDGMSMIRYPLLPQICIRARRARFRPSEAVFTFTSPVNVRQLPPYYKLYTRIELYRVRDLTIAQSWHAMCPMSGSSSPLYYGQHIHHVPVRGVRLTRCLEQAVKIGRLGTRNDVLCPEGRCTMHGLYEHVHAVVLQG